MAKFDDEEIGGREYDAVNWRYAGDTDRARELRAVARKLLGNMKRFMDISAVTTLMHTHIAKDGTVYRMHSNRNGAHDIDRMLIYVPPGGGGRKRKRCLGYIVQCINDKSLINDVFYYYASCLIKTELPSGDVLNSKSYGPYSLSDVTPTGADDFPDLGAKWLPYLAWDGSAYTAPSDFQLVSTIIQLNGITYEKLGPRVYTQGPASGFLYPGTNTLNPGWSYVTTYSIDSGVCGVDEEGGGPVGYSFESIPCTCPIRVASVRQTSTEVYTAPGTFTSATLFYSGTWTHVPLPFFPDQCHPDYPKASASDLVDRAHAGNNVNSTKVNDWDSRAGAIWTAAWNDASAAAYEYDIAHHYFDTTDNSYIRVYGDVGAAHLNAILRRSDKKGFITYSGFYVNEGVFTFTQRNAGYGQTALFMLPFDERRRLRYSAEVKAAVAANDFHQDTDFSVGAASWLGGPGDPDFDCGAGMMGTVTAPTEANVIEHWDITGHCAGDFALPLVVEAGVHKVGVAGNSGDAVVWLLLEGDDGLSGFVKIKKTFTTHNLWKSNFDTPDLNIHIKVGEFNEIGELVQFEQM